MEELTENKDELITARDRQQDRKQDPEDRQILRPAGYVWTGSQNCKF